MSSFRVTESVVVWLPLLFWEDHDERELPAGEVLTRTARLVKVRLSPDDFDEMLSDASYYSSPYGPRDFSGARGLSQSASATVRRLMQAWREQQGTDSGGEGGA